MKKWEYWLIYPKDWNEAEEQLDILGGDGWELVSSVFYPETSSSVDDSYLTLVFKRELIIRKRKKQ